MTAPASAGLATKIDNPGAPVKITQCLSGLADYQITYNVNFVNQGAEPATAIRFDFILNDGFGQLLAVQPADKLGTFAPGVQIGNQYYATAAGAGAAWTGPSIGPVVSVVCTVEMVKFVDGSVWKGPRPANYDAMSAPVLPP